MNKKALILLLLTMLMAGLLTGCGEYQKLLKSNDPELKYQKAVEYFNLKQYTKAQTLFDDISTYYKGTERSQDVLNYLARCYMGQKDYASACDYYQIYLRNYPKGRYIVETRYMIGHCFYLDSPDPRLDQTQTHQAIEYLTQFTELYPESDYAALAYKEIDEMYNKLAQKEYLSAKLYYNLGTYLGNNYEACATVARNALKLYPGNIWQEELNWLILQSKYQQVLRSVEELRMERAQDTADESYAFLAEYPESKHKKAAERIKTEMQRLTGEK
ncbi:MAG: outer membrane protein assembly factor BamD [Paludibacteraceae bacterium]|nr:outer membrane protein assembly factor BamD [Paludibacteraceae bacterium]